MLLKALLVHGAERPDLGYLAAAEPGLDVENLSVRLAGYGLFQLDRVTSSTDSRVTLIGWGPLGQGAAHLYELPLPASLSGHRGYRRITATLAWMSPISTSQRYRRVAMWFEPYGPDRDHDDATTILRLTRADGDYARPRRGTVQHEVFEGIDAVAFEAGRSCVFQINCRAESPGYGGPVRYAFVVTIETRADLPLYEEIAARIRPRVEVSA